MKVMYHEYDEETLRAYCRTSIEALERWARLVIDRELINQYGYNYFDAKMENGDPVIKSEINEKATDMLAKHPDRFKRKIDTLFLDEIIYLLCKVQLYKKVFKKILDEIYPDGCAEARTYLNRLVPIRNKLSHSNPVSIRETEMAICYSHDFVDGVKSYFAKVGENRMFNVPQAVKLNDSLGNEYILKNNSHPEIIRIMNQSGILEPFYVNERISFEVTMDPSFEGDSYDIFWTIKGEIKSKTEKLLIVIDESMVGEETYITFHVKQKKAWHKYTTGCDQYVIVVIQVLPPQE